MEIGSTLATNAIVDTKFYSQGGSVEKDHYNLDKY